MKNNSWKGSVSIFLVLAFTVILSLLLTLIEGARQNAIRLKAECAYDLAMQSVFAEYNRELLEQYELFFIDVTYGNGGNIHCLEDHFKGYLTDNTDLGETYGLIKDLTAVYPQNVTVDAYSLATDAGGEVLKRQAVGYMKNLYGMDYLKEIQSELATVEDYDLVERDITSERLSNQSAIDNFEIPPKKKDATEDEWEEVEIDNPADAVNATRGILSLVIDADTEISTMAVNPQNYVSGRSLNVGSGLGKREGVGAADELIFHEYLLQFCGYYTEPKEEGLLQYQVEYILMGKSSDIDNLKAIVNRLLLLRETANVTYLFSDEAKVAEAEALAATVCAAVALPELTELVKISLLFAWAYAESVYDVKQLLKGGRVPIVKTAETWHYSLEGMLQFTQDGSADVVEQTADDADTVGASDETIADGLSYKDYLRVFLALEGSEKKTKRAMDIIEMDIRKTPGNAGFRLDCCVDRAVITANFASKYGGSCEITREWYYY
ncbi:MAG: DUF5702 domain-containing protein [Lachnospiraceae bacterium]|nr:DUF5702 domain-containing protein [Lachnospiraceae bacterium]